MSLKHPVPGLRPLWYNANSARKVEVTVSANEVLHVSDDLAAQLQRADTHFTEVAADFVAPQPPESVDETETVEAEQPAAKTGKRTTKKG